MSLLNRLPAWNSKSKNAPVTDLKVGEIIPLGSYPQLGDKPSAVAWIVIHIQDGKALLLSKYALITAGYCDPERKSIRELEWKNSLARKACGKFYEECFSPAEQALLCKKQISQGRSEEDCTDYVFLLSEEEAVRYLPSTEKRKCEPSPAAKAAGARLGWTTDTEKYTSWWLLPECRDLDAGYILIPGTNEKYTREIYPKAVFQTGEIQFHSRNGYHIDFTIRPAIIVDIHKLGR